MKTKTKILWSTHSTTNELIHLVCLYQWHRTNNGILKYCWYKRIHWKQHHHEKFFCSTGRFVFHVIVMRDFEWDFVNALNVSAFIDWKRIDWGKRRSRKGKEDIRFNHGSKKNDEILRFLLVCVCVYLFSCIMQQSSRAAHPILALSDKDYHNSNES